MAKANKIKIDCFPRPEGRGKNLYCSGSFFCYFFLQIKWQKNSTKGIIALEATRYLLKNYNLLAGCVLKLLFLLYLQDEYG